MRHRCLNPNADNYDRYGGNGVIVSPRWDSFELFLEDMGPRPTGTTLDRIQSCLGYIPGNCRWVTTHDQQRNISTNIWVTLNDTRLCLKDWAVKLGLNYQTVYMRIERGMTTAQALTTSVKKRNKC